MIFVYALTILVWIYRSALECNKPLPHSTMFLSKGLSSYSEPFQGLRQTIVYVFALLYFVLYSI